MMRIAGALTLSLWVLSSFVACGSNSDESTPATCASDPSSCGAGKTCWVNAMGNGYSCLDEAAGQTAGSPCQNVLGAAQCAAGLACFPSVSGSASGVCSPFCATAAPDGDCSNGGVCTQLTLQGTTAHLYVCSPGATGTGGTGGTGGGAGASSGGSAGTSSGGSSSGGTGGGTGGTAGAAPDAG